MTFRDQLNRTHLTITFTSINTQPNSLSSATTPTSSGKHSAEVSPARKHIEVIDIDDGEEGEQQSVRLGA
ncbi:hypothetical protein [Streptomyces sp. MMBL 11-3]|uniref:hypothetical protein n=1 Tax=Streptomyces sp. MMBL 11-3 TaxID=3382639 RepID=UPI0039B43B1E